jgi:Divergent InlB B-repeat domain
MNPLLLCLRALVRALTAVAVLQLAACVWDEPPVDSKLTVTSGPARVAQGNTVAVAVSQRCDGVCDRTDPTISSPLPAGLAYTVSYRGAFIVSGNPAGHDWEFRFTAAVALAPQQIRITVRLPDLPNPVEVGFDLEVFDPGPTVGGQGRLLTMVVPAGGIVRSTPAGLDCAGPATCLAQFASGTTVALTAVPDTGQRFVAYTGDADCTDGSLTLDAPRRCEVQFAATAAAGWRAVATLTQAGPAVAAFIGKPAVVLDARGDAIVAWIENGELLVRLADGRIERPNAGSVGSRSAAETPALLLGPGGEPWVAWAEETPSDGLDLRVRRFDGRRWLDVGGNPLEALRSDDAFHPSLALHNGEVVLAWVEGGQGARGLQVRRAAGGTWQALGDGSVPGGRGVLERPLLAAAPGAALALAWFDGDGLPQVARFDGTRWSATAGPVLPAGASAVSERTGFVQAPGVGLLLATASRSRGGFSVRLWNGGAWSDLGVPLAAADSTVIDITLAARGAQPLLAFSQVRSQGAVRETLVLRWTGSAWAPQGEPVPRATRHGDNGTGWGLALADDAKPVLVHAVRGNLPGSITTDDTLLLMRFE